MPDYSPPPADLSRLNPIQRYMQKGELDRQDWLRLGALILFYFIARPYIQSGAQWLFAPKEGLQEQQAYQERRAKAKIGANTIRGSEKVNLDDLVEVEDKDDTAVVTGSKVDGNSEVVNRKKKSKPGPISPEQDKLLNWEDEPARKPAAGDKADVMEWLDKWDE